jgi:hypothetical protein
MKKLFLDDEREPYDSSWDVVRSYTAFVKYIEENGVPDVISFDHDLAFEHYPFNQKDPGGGKIPYSIYEELTGYHAAKYLIEKNLFPTLAIVHSYNPVGAANIRDLLRPHTEVLIHPYGTVKVMNA